jgi:hypothetical protein
MRSSGVPKYLCDTFFSASSFIKLCAVIALAAGFTYLYRNILFTDINEFGDIAANSLLVQNAKHFNLLTGHYSRLGFYHPGPAILYILALGEWVFYDCFGWVKAPLAGQMIAVGAYNAFWIVMLATLLIRMHRSIAVASAALLLLLGACTYFDPTVFNELWFPHLFLLPFATFTLALAQLIAGRNDSLVILALSCGFLIHGHVSFVAICSVMLSGALLMNRFQPDRTTVVFTRDFVKEHSAQLKFITVIVVLFLSPLILESIRNFPGPIAQYASYGSGHQHNNLASALQFTAKYWNIGITPAITGTLALIYFWRHCKGVNDNTSSARYSAAAAQALLLATVALVFYTMYGIDELMDNYLGIFYYAVPASALSLMCVSFLVQRSRTTQIIVAIVIAAVVFPYMVRQIFISKDRAAQFHNAQIAKYFEKVKSLSNDTIVLDLDPSKDWEVIWTTLVGIEIYAARHQKAQLFCIRNNWQILFTKEAKCIEQQIQHGDRFVVSASPDLVKSIQHSAIDISGIRFYKVKPTMLAVGSMLNVADHLALYINGILDNGWSVPESEFVWSEGNHATLSFIIDSNTSPVRLVLDMAAFLPGDIQQTVDISINGVPAGTIHFDAQNNRGKRAMPLSTAMLGSNGAVTVQLNIDNPISPQAAGLGTDNRALGIGLYGIEVEDN